MSSPDDRVTFDPRPIRIGNTWYLLATHGLSGQQEHIAGFHTEETTAFEQRMSGVAAHKRLSGRRVNLRGLPLNLTAPVWLRWLISLRLPRRTGR